MKHASTWLAVTAGAAILAFGANDPGTVALLQCAVAVIAVVEFWAAERRTVSWPVLAVVFTLALWPLLQMLPMPASVWQALAPARAAAYEQVLGPWKLTSAAYPLTVQTQATLQAWLRLVCYLLVFLVALSWERRRVPNVLPTFLVAIGLFEAVYGLVQYLGEVQYIFAFPKEYFTDRATGTYTNHCRFAGLLEMVLPFFLAGILFPRHEMSPTRRRWTTWFTDESFGTLRQIVAFTVVFLGLLFSKCRMGILSMVVTLTLVALMALFRRGKGAGPLLLAVLAVPLSYALWVGIAPVSERFEQLDLHAGDHVRPVLWRDALSLIRDNPWFGTGFGTYNFVSPGYQTRYFQFRIDHAHNDYLEWAAELGVPAAALLFGSMWWLTIRLAGSLRRLQRRNDLVVASGCCGAILALLLHSITDFNLASPANAVVLAWICGTGAGLLARVREDRR